MSNIHFLNVLEGDCNIIQHDPQNGQSRVTVIDVCNADNGLDTDAEKAKKASQGRKDAKTRNYVPPSKINYRQKEEPDNPHEYLEKYGINSIFRFIVTHPDMDHLDGIKDLFDEIAVTNVWDTDNEKKLTDFSNGLYNPEDWDFYTAIRDGGNTDYSRRAYLSKSSAKYFDEDNLTILAPTQALIDEANECDDFNDSSFVLLFTPPKKGGGKWKILFAGDSHDKTWEYILGNKELKSMVSDIDVLFAPHHGRDSDRNYDFLKTLKPRLTLFGNASCNHLAYDSYPKLRITNNQAGYVVLKIDEEAIKIFVKNKEFADHFRLKRDWDEAWYSKEVDAYSLGQFTAK